MEILHDFSIVLGILIIFFVIFLLPFFYVIHRIYYNEHLIVKIFFSMTFGIFVSISITTILAALGRFSVLTFIGCYLFIAVSVNVYLLRKLKSSNMKLLLFSLFKIPIKKMKTIIHSHVFYLLLLAFGIGFYLRMGFAFSHNALASIDPYGHLLVSKFLAQGLLVQPIGYYDEGARGFHIVVTLTNFYSGIDLYSIQRFFGGILGVISIGSVYCLASALKDKTAGFFAAIIYSGAVIIPEIDILIVRQTQSIPEVLALVILPITILSAYKLIDNGSFKFQMKYIVLLGISLLTLWVIHPLTTLVAIYLILIIVAIGLIFNRKLSLLIIIFIFVTFIVILSHPTVAGKFQFYFVKWDRYLPELFVLKDSYIPSVSTFILMELAVLSITYGALTKQKAIIFVGTACFLFGFMETTGYLIISRLPLERIMPFFAITVALMIGISFSEIIERIGSLPSKINILKHEIPLRFNKSKLRIAVLIIFIASLLILVPTKSPSLEHFGYEDSVEATLSISNKYPKKETTIYSEMIFHINRERAIIEPDGVHFELHELIEVPPLNFTPITKYTFIFIEKKPFPYRSLINIGLTQSSRVMEIAKKWVNEYMTDHDNIEIYYESRDIQVYLITVEL